MAHHHYTEMEVNWVRNNRLLFDIRELTRRFNARFGAGVSQTALYGLCNRHGIESADDGRFKQGAIPHNKGIKGPRVSVATEFKKGQRPANAKPVGSERITIDGYVEVKIAEPKKWRAKQRVIWESLHGPAPKGHAVIFVDGDMTNFETENLALVSRAELVRLNQQQFRQQPQPLRKTHIAIVKLDVKVRKIETGQA